MHPGLPPPETAAELRRHSRARTADGSRVGFTPALPGDLPPRPASPARRALLLSSSSEFALFQGGGWFHPHEALG